MGDRRRARGRYDGARRRGTLVQKYRLSIPALALALLGCHEVETRKVFFKVTNPVSGCKSNISDCDVMTLQCVGSVRAILTPENGVPIVGQCMTSSGATTTLCDPTRLFPQPLFDQLSGGRVSLRIIGYKDANCTDANELFETHTGVFDVATAASSPAPVAMTASCTAADGMVCDQVLNVQGNIVGWPPDMQRDPPQISGVNYQVGFGYVVPGTADMPTVYLKLFDVAYNPLPTAGHSLTGVGVLPMNVGSPPCIGYQATAIPAQGITTLTCFDRSVFVGAVQPLDAYYVSLDVASAAQRIWMTPGGGVLLGQVTNNGSGLGGATVTQTGLPPGRIYYYDSSMMRFVQTSSTTDGSGVFAITGDMDAATPVFIQAVGPAGTGSTPTLPEIILPRQATIVDLKL